MDEEVEKLRKNAIKAINMLIEYRNTIGTVKEAKDYIKDHDRLSEEYFRVGDNYIFCMECLKQILSYAEEKEDEVLEQLVISMLEKLIPVPEDEDNK